MVPASITRLSRSTVTIPLARSTRRRATQAVQVGMRRTWPKLVAMPSPTSFGIVSPQPAFSAARARTAAWRRAPPRPADGVRRRSGVAPSAVQQPQAELHPIDGRGVSGLVHEALDRPVGPARPDRAQPSRPEGPVGQIVRQRAHPLGADIVPVIGAVDREGIVADAVYALGHV